MIVVDTSALMAIALNEPEAGYCAATLETEDRALISAGTVAETLIVSARRNIEKEVHSLIEGLGLEISPVTSDSARRAADAYRQWGKGIHPTALNFGDCFAYELAKTHACPLLYVGGDFAKTDIQGTRPTTPKNKQKIIRAHQR